MDAADDVREYVASGNPDETGDKPTPIRNYRIGPLPHTQLHLPTLAQFGAHATVRQKAA